MAYRKSSGGMGSQYGRGNRLAAALAPDAAAISNIKGDTQGLAYALEKGLQGLFAGMDAKEQRMFQTGFAEAMRPDPKIVIESGENYDPEIEDQNKYNLDIDENNPDDLAPADKTGEPMPAYASAFAPKMIKPVMGADPNGRDLSTRLTDFLSSPAMKNNRYAGDMAMPMAMQQMARDAANTTYQRGRDDKRKDATTLYGRGVETAKAAAGAKESVRLQALIDQRETQKRQSADGHRLAMIQLAQKNTNKRKLGSIDQQNYRAVVAQIPQGQPVPTFGEFLEQKQLYSQGIIRNPAKAAGPAVPVPGAQPQQQFMQHDNGIDTVGQQVQAVPYAGPMPSQAQGMTAPATSAQPGYTNVPGGRADVNAKSQAVRNETLRVAEARLRLQEEQKSPKYRARIRREEKQVDRDIKREEAQPSRRNGILSKIERQPMLQKNMDEVIRLSKGSLTSGPIGQAMSTLSNSDQYALNKAIKVIQSAVGIDELIEAKKSGATFGALSNQELTILTNAMGALDGNLDTSKLQETFTTIMRLYNKAIDRSVSDYKGMYKQGFDVPMGVKEEDIQTTMQRHGMTRKQVIEKLMQRPQ